ncbi:hypothetical protein BGX38DRAFT_1198955, partial [Terfezia claveryi]
MVLKSFRSTSKCDRNSSLLTDQYFLPLFHSISYQPPPPLVSGIVRSRGTFVPSSHTPM